MVEVDGKFLNLSRRTCTVEQAARLGIEVRPGHRPEAGTRHNPE